VVVLLGREKNDTTKGVWNELGKVGGGLLKDTSHRMWAKKNLKAIAKGRGGFGERVVEGGREQTKPGGENVVSTKTGVEKGGGEKEKKKKTKKNFP